MRILGFSLDNSILNPDSPQASRVIEYGRQVAKYEFIVFSHNFETVRLSDQVLVYGIKKGFKFFSLFRFYNFAKKILSRQRFDLISVQDQYYLALIGYWLAQKFNLGLELQIHGFEKFYGLRRLVAQYVIPRASALRCVSHRLKDQLITEFGVEASKIVVAPIFVETIVQETAIKEKQGQNLIFLTVGRLVPVKNIDLQIQAISHLSNKYPQIELWIVGDGPEKDSLKFKVKSLKLDSRVKFFGWQNNLDQFYRQADIYLLTSNYEGWGMAVIEAASYGLPIIMTDVGCAGEVIINNKSGLIIPVAGRQALEKEMTKLITSQDWRKKIGEAAKEAVLNLPKKGEIINLYKKSWEIALANKG